MSPAWIWARVNLWLAVRLTAWAEWHSARAYRTAKGIEAYRIEQQWRETHGG